ncbi:hypothetical protein [Almyronema epifaneia]|uniref:DUF1049 domain-containing protein n=1 Tax=Almyronema epifaneia S1 TaxID=2991925 RepID=A0ABW6IBX9_9CYAN
MKDKLINILNWLLVINLFFVLFSFFWFATALVGRSFDFNLGFDLWYALWDPLFMPAIGILMAGSLLSGLISWVNRRLAAKEG